MELAAKKQQDDRALIRVSIVDGDHPERVLFNTLVKQPESGCTIVDYKTDIHGITPDQIAAATLTFRHVQAAVSRMLCDRTIIVGHSVHGDLKSLKIRHHAVVDTAYL